MMIKKKVNDKNEKNENEQKEKVPPKINDDDHKEQTPPKQVEIESEREKPPKEQVQSEEVEVAQIKDDIKKEEEMEVMEETEDAQKGKVPPKGSEKVPEAQKQDIQSEHEVKSEPFEVAQKLSLKLHVQNEQQSESKPSALSKSLETKSSDQEQENDGLGPMKTPPFNPNNPIIAHPEHSDSESHVSSYRSDKDAPFGNRWGDFELNESMEQHNKTEEKMEEIEKKENMNYAQIVIIGQSKSGKTAFLNKITANNGECAVFDDECCCSFIETSGNMENVGSIINAISVSDIAVILVNLKEECNIKEMVYLLNTLGVDRCIVCLSNIDGIDYEQKKYDVVRAKIEKLMKKIGIKPKKTAFIPVDCMKGDNILKESDNKKLEWFKGWTLKKNKGITVKEAIKAMVAQFKSKKNVDDKMMVLPVYNIIDKKKKNECIVCGKVEQGVFHKTDTLKSVNSDSLELSINAIYRNKESMHYAEHGDFVQIEVKHNEQISVGDVLYVDNKLDIKPCRSVTALVAVSSSKQLNVGKVAGLICIRSNKVQCELTKINWKMGKNGKKIKDAKYLEDKEQAQIQLTFKSPFIATSFANCESLGRFVVIDEKNKPVLVGKIESVSH